MTQNNRNIEINTYANFYNPYNFVPHSHNVYFPVWRNIISHDIPFSDGLSGEIDVQFEALTPLIVKEAKTNPANVSINGKYFIPATSLKGMVRNVLEILSLSKIGHMTTDNKYSVRDLTPANIDYTLKSRSEKIEAGLLVKVNDIYYLIECPKYEKLSYEEIEEITELSGILIGKLKNKQSVKEKYDLINKKYFYGDEEGNTYVLFFSGRMQNKMHEFGVKIPKKFELKKVDKKLMDNFLFIHEKETKSKSWSFWKSKIKNLHSIPTYDQISTYLIYAPVFYSKGDNDEILSLGLSFLHREPYKYSVHHFIDENHKTDDLDLAQCIFGNSDNNLKGRVQFSHAFVEMNNNSLRNEAVDVLLGSPKPTFYPFYLKQSGNKVSTFSDSNGEINGWKRYLVHETIVNQEFASENQNVRTKIKPLPSGVLLQTKIRFHNIKPAELGAILSALTFHNNSDRCFHLIGMAKPLGYGKLQIKKMKLSVVDDNRSVKDFMKLFEIEICNSVFKGKFDDWKKEILPLFFFAQGNFQMPIHYPMNFDSFKQIKRERLSLAYFSPNPINFQLLSLNK